MNDANNLYAMFFVSKPKYKCICNAGWTTQGNDPACTVDDDECSKDQYPCSVNPTVQCQNYPGSFMCGPCPVGKVLLIISCHIYICILFISW